MQINGWDRGAVKPLTAFLPSDLPPLQSASASKGAPPNAPTFTAVPVAELGL